ncbi:MAG: hypothetical protein ABIF01_02400 [Candidatus Micrarchaeota archaeon]
MAKHAFHIRSGRGGYSISKIMDTSGHGTSDNPSSRAAGPIGLNRQGNFKTKVGEFNSARLYSPDNVLDVDGTNQWRIKYAFSHGLRPIVKQKDMVMYREVRKDGDGLLTLNYSQTAPGNIVLLTPDEKIPKIKFDPAEAALPPRKRGALIKSQ